MHNSITVSAPGKIHLLGEHSVVYGFPALLSAVDRRVYVKIRNRKSEIGIKNEKEEIRIVKKNCHPELDSGSENYELLYKVIEVLKKEYKIGNLPHIEITINSQIPIGSGMGSSAAISAALLGALLKYVKNIWNPVKINNLAYDAEKIFHGNPSGADNTAVVFGGLVWYRREFEFLKSIWSLPVSSYKFPKFAVINTGKPAETTKEMVQKVKNNYLKNRKLFETIFSNQEKNTKKLLLSLKTGDNKLLKEAITCGERNLEKIGIVGKRAEKIIRKIESLGGAAKVCGAGGIKKGSGIILCFHPDFNKLKLFEKKSDLKFENIILGGEGIRLEKSGN